MKKRDKLAVVFPVLVFALLYIVGCAASPPPTAEDIAAAEAAVNEAKAAGCPACAPEECAAAESALAQGKALAGQFCAELEARRLLVDAKAKAEEAKNKCAQSPPGAPLPPSGETFGLKDIFFDFNRSDIRPDADAVLQENAEVLKNNPNITVVVEGYADLRGSVDYNLGLAQRRADATKAALVSLGVDPSRIQAVGKGETSKFAAGSSEDSYQLNRRASFVPVGGGSPAGPGARIILKISEPVL